MNCKGRLLPSAALLLLATVVCAAPLTAQETIVAIRHAEKPTAATEQLTCRGLNRALALPKVLIGRFGKPDALYASDPAAGVNGKHPYLRIRPLLTIEPTAIELGMPVNAQIGFTDIAGLQAALTAPANAHALIFVAWEHKMLNQFAKQMLKSDGDDPSLVLRWPNSDYDRIYVFRITRNGSKPKLTFTIEHENLNNSLSNTCPGPAS